MTPNAFFFMTIFLADSRAGLAEVEVEQRPDFLHLSLSLNLNLNLPMTLADIFSILLNLRARTSLH